MNRKAFERVVEKALAEIPEEFRSHIDNIAIVVEDEPSPADLEDLEDDGGELLGIFRGEPLTTRSWEAPAGPSHIAIFRGPILRCCETEQEAIAEIRDTVVHELGHYFGLDDHEMEY